MSYPYKGQTTDIMLAFLQEEASCALGDIEELWASCTPDRDHDPDDHSDTRWCLDRLHEHLDTFLKVLRRIEMHLLTEQENKRKEAHDTQ